MSDVKPMSRAAKVSSDAYSPESMREVLRAQKKFVVFLDEGREENDPKRVYVGVNGYAYWLERGKEHILPESIVKVLELSAETKYRTKYDAENKPYMENYSVPAYPYRVLREATPQDIEKHKALNRRVAA